MKKLYALLLLAIFPNLASAYDALIDGIYYNLNTANKTAEVTFLKNVNYGGDNASAYIGEIVIPSTVQHEGIEYSVESIGYSAFGGCKDVVSVSIPLSVTAIGGGAFYECTGLKDLFIHHNINSIGTGILQGCSGLSSISVENGNAKYDSRNDCNAIIDTETNELIAGCMNTIIPDGITAIKHGAFDSCVGLTSISIPSSVTAIGKYAFWGCTGLTQLIFPSSVTTIDDWAFESCTNLNSVTIPNSKISFGKAPFGGCTAIASVTSEILEPYSIKDDVFPEAVYRHATLYVPLGTKELYCRFGGWSNFLKIQELSSGDAVNYLTIYDGGNGKTKLLVKYGENYTFEFEPENGWLINTLTYDGMDVTDQIDNLGRYTTPAITASATISVVYGQTQSSVRSITNNKYTVYATEGKIIIKNTDGTESVRVYSESGALLSNLLADKYKTVVNLDGNHIYIIKVGEDTYKTFVR